MHSHGKEDQQAPGLHCEEQWQQAGGSHPSYLLSVAYWLHCWSIGEYVASWSVPKPIKMMKELEHQSYMQSLRELRLSSLERRGRKETLSICRNI